MAQLRLIAGALAIVLAGAACRSSEAAPSSGLTAPAGWRAMPDIAKAAQDIARGANLRVDGAQAWGEPARGCYAAWLSASGAAGAPDVLADRMVADLSSAKALPGISVTEVVKPAKKSAQQPAQNVDAGVLSLAFAAGEHHGRVRAQIAKSGATVLLACFWNQREPAACEAACKPLLEQIK